MVMAWLVLVLVMAWLVLVLVLLLQRVLSPLTVTLPDISLPPSLRVPGISASSPFQHICSFSFSQCLVATLCVVCPNSLVPRDFSKGKNDLVGLYLGKVFPSGHWAVE